MAMEWSHNPEAYENGRKNLAKVGVGELLVIQAEWEATDWDDEETMVGPQLNSSKYDKELLKLKKEDRLLTKRQIHSRTRREWYADQVWKKAEQLRTCENGGHEAWVCPYGCHTVAW